MVDDVVTISECGYKSVMTNSYMQSKTNSKKLQYGISKCKKIHIGKQCEDFKCHSLFVDSWEEREVKNEHDGRSQIEDICIGEEIMGEKHEGNYLGDIISKDGRNLKNIKARINKGKGIVHNILDGVPSGKLYFQVAILLRNSLLETVDVAFIRSIRLQSQPLRKCSS